MDQVKRACFRCENVSVIEFSKDKRAPAKGIAHRDQFLLAHDQERERAFDSAQRAQHAAAVIGRTRQQMQNDFAIGGSLENGTFAFQFVAQQIGVNQIAVVRDCHLPAHAIDHERLRILQRARSGGGITGMPDRARPFQFLQLLLSENL